MGTRVLNQGSLEDRIRRSLDTLSHSHRRVAEYLLQTEIAAAFSTARQIGEHLDISESTVVRLAPELGYDGFPALQAELRQRLVSKIEWRTPSPVIDHVLNDPYAVLCQVLQNDIATLQHALESVGPEAFNNAVHAILKADAIYVLGLRTSAAHAFYATMRLRLLHHKTYFMSSHLGDLPDQMLAVTGRDLLIAISYFRYAADTLRALRQARTLGAQTLIITDEPISPPSKAADIVLLAPSKASKLFHSPVAPLSLVNALVAAATVADKKRSTARMARAYETIDAFEVLLAPGEAPRVEGDTAL